MGTKSGASVVNAKAVADGLERADAVVSRMDVSPPEATALMKAELQRVGQTIFGGDGL